MYVTISEIDGQCNSMHEAGQPKPVLWDNPEGWGGEGRVKGGSRYGDTCVTMAD